MKINLKEEFRDLSNGIVIFLILLCLIPFLIIFGIPIMILMGLETVIGRIGFHFATRKNKCDYIVFYCENDSYNEVINKELLAVLDRPIFKVPHGLTDANQWTHKFARWAYVDSLLPVIIRIESIRKVKRIRLRKALIKYFAGNHQKITNIREKLKGHLVTEATLAADEPNTEYDSATITEDQFRKLLAEELRQDANFHRQNRWQDFGNSFEDLEIMFSRFEKKEFVIANRFWDSWIDEVNHDFPNNYNIEKEEWPKLAEELMKNLITSEEITNNKLIALL